jgi:hypothetical protein
VAELAKEFILEIQVIIVYWLLGIVQASQHLFNGYQIAEPLLGEM